jgi:hypothetical protein
MNDEPREEGWYPVLIKGGLACLYWDGRQWEIPRVARRLANPACEMQVGARIAWPDD